jgi:predicted transcriptional regulator of viral defense system
MKGLSGKEIEVVSWLELEQKRFFTRKDIGKFFRSRQEMSVYLHILKKKKRVVRINKSKYYLVPIQAYRNYWTEHPYIIVDEMFNGKNYYIGGISAANYWHLTEQIPIRIDVYCTNKQGTKTIFNAVISFKRQRKISRKDYVGRFIKEHPFNIATKRKSKKWR